MRIKMAPRTKMFIATAVSCMSLFLAAAPAFALSVPGYSGRPTSGSSTCFSDSSSIGAAVNTCGSSVFYELPLPSNQGSHTITVATNNPGGTTYACTLYGYTNTGTLWSSSSTWFPSTGDTTFTLTATVPAQGHLFMVCQVAAGGKLYNVNYTP